MNLRHSKKKTDTRIYMEHWKPCYQNIIPVTDMCSRDAQTHFALSGLKTQSIWGPLGMLYLLLSATTSRNKNRAAWLMCLTCARKLLKFLCSTCVKKTHKLTRALPGLRSQGIWRPLKDASTLQLITNIPHKPVLTQCSSCVRHLITNSL